MEGGAISKFFGRVFYLIVNNILFFSSIFFYIYLFSMDMERKTCEKEERKTGGMRL